ncbi:MAG: hypothetical protein IPN66_09405 [Candidatus Competibacteraceae bacterium]|nr:hypothetical protein [Candidatus Competibacteraceae bacterium]
MKADLAKREPDTLRHWRELVYIDASAPSSPGRPKFVLHDGRLTPMAPFIGHAVNKVLKDIMSSNPAP